MAIAHSMLKDTVFPTPRKPLSKYYYMYFFLLFYWHFPKKIHPKCAPDRSISISKMQKLLRMGRGDTPLPDPPPARALRALACVFPTILQILPPTDLTPHWPGIFFCSCPPPPPPDNRHLVTPLHTLATQCVIACMGLRESILCCKTVTGPFWPVQKVHLTPHQLFSKDPLYTERKKKGVWSSSFSSFLTHNTVIMSTNSKEKKKKKKT